MRNVLTFSLALSLATAAVAGPAGPPAPVQPRQSPAELAIAQYAAEQEGSADARSPYRIPSAAHRSGPDRGTAASDAFAETTGPATRVPVDQHPRRLTAGPTRAAPNR